MENFKVRINKYSCYETKDFHVEDEQDRTAAVFDKLIELAARKCDRYASDIFWDMKQLSDCVEAEREFDRLLFFRENGVHSIDTEKIKEYNSFIDLNSLKEEKCIWRLRHTLALDEFNKPSWMTYLTRVRLNIEK